MKTDFTLKEPIVHGTKEFPIEYMHFTTGNGTPYPDHFLVDRHWHDNCEILFIKKGHFKVELDLESKLLYEGDLCIVNSEQLHRLEGLTENTIHDVIIFHPQILSFSYPDELQQKLIAPFLARQAILPSIIRPSDAGYQQIRSLFELMSTTSIKDCYFTAKLGLLSLFHEFSIKNCFHMVTRNQRNESERLKIDRYKSLVSYMESHYQETITLEELSTLVNCNSQYLCHFFKEISGVSPIQYLIHFRIEQAKKELQETTKSILEISFDCGFDNISYFIRQFKKIAGVTPRQFRNNFHYE